MRQSRHLSRVMRLALLLWALPFMLGQTASLGGRAAAQGPASIGFAAPEALSVSVDAGDDFATTVLGDPWDMDRARDVQYEIGFTGISAANGIWSGTYSGVDHASGAQTSGYLFPLFQGFSTPIQGLLSQELPLNKVGAQDRYAIDASKYTRLTYRMSVTPRSAQGPFAVMWTNARPVTWPDGSQRFADLDACQGTTAFFPWNGWRVYDFDMTRPNGAPNARAGVWQGLVRGLRIDPLVIPQAGVQVNIDWIRLSDPASAPTIAIPWSAAGAAATDRVDIYVADNPDGRDAAPLAHGLPVSAGRYDLATSILPPGQHYFQLRLKDGVSQNGCTVTRAVSNWVGPLTIAPVPILTFARPSMLSGPDYALSELGRAWDMQSGDDIVAVNPPGWPPTIADVRFNDGILTARAVYHPTVNGQPLNDSDAQLWLRVNPQRPIDTTYYRYFSVRLKVDVPPSRDINWAIKNGWGMRIFWWDRGLTSDGSETKYGTYLEGWNIYSVDLARSFPPLPLSDPRQANNILTPREESTFPNQAGWTQIRQARALRFDPLETTPAAVGTGADVFQIDWIRLTANDEVVRGQPFTVEAGVNVPPSTLRSVTFFYTTDRQNPFQNPARPAVAEPAPAAAGPANASRVHLPFVGNRTAVRNPVPIVGNPLAFQWDTSTVAPGTYYVCARIESGSRTYSYCSETPVVVRP